MFRRTVLVVAVGVCTSLAAVAQIQGVCGQTSNQNKIGCTIANLYNTPPTFNPGVMPVFQNGFPASSGGGAFDFVPPQSALNAALGTELTTLPLTAPGSGFVFQLDKASGLEVRSTQSLGPILAERGDTIGRHKLFLAFAYQYFKFSSEDGISTKSFHNVIQHANDGSAEGSDLISTTDAIDLKIHQFTVFATYGLTDRVDISAVLPFLNVRLGAYSTATINNIDQNPTAAHSFCTTPGCLTQSFSNFKEGSGIGDVVFRVKARVWGGEHAKLAIGTDLRLPTGDELNFRGSGTYGVRPFAALSYSKGRFAPHANLGFEVNGDSILAGNFSTNTKAHLPNELTYSLGTDVGISSRFTLAADWLGERIINGLNAIQSSCSETVPPATGSSAACTQAGNTGASGAQTFTFPQTIPVRSSYSVNDLAIGAKISPVKNLLISLNGMFKLDDPGLRSKVVPLISVGYTF